MLKTMLSELNFIIKMLKTMLKQLKDPYPYVNKIKCEKVDKFLTSKLRKV